MDKDNRLLIDRLESTNAIPMGEFVGLVDSVMVGWLKRQELLLNITYDTVDSIVPFIDNITRLVQRGTGGEFRMMDDGFRLDFDHGHLEFRMETTSLALFDPIFFKPFRLESVENEVLLFCTLCSTFNLVMLKSLIPFAEVTALTRDKMDLTIDCAGNRNQIELFLGYLENLAFKYISPKCGPINWSDDGFYVEFEEGYGRLKFCLDTESLGEKFLMIAALRRKN